MISLSAISGPASTLTTRWKALQFGQVNVLNARWLFIFKCALPLFSRSPAKIAAAATPRQPP